MRAKENVLVSPNLFVFDVFVFDANSAIVHELAALFVNF